MAVIRQLPTGDMFFPNGAPDRLLLTEEMACDSAAVWESPEEYVRVAGVMYRVVEHNRTFEVYRLQRCGFDCNTCGREWPNRSLAKACCDGAA